MNEPRLPNGIVAQAVYTWSPTLVNGSKGMGFSAISPSLVGSIDWLSRLNPPEFDLFQGDVTGAPSDLTGAKKDFSEVGRILVDGIAIAYRKTADGEVSKPGRPHQVVHAVMAKPAILGLSCMTRIRDDFWIRKVEGPGGGNLNLVDLALADLLEVQDASTGHSCPAYHEDAENLLQLLAECQFEAEGTIALGSTEAIMAVSLAFPEKVANGFSVTPFVAIGGVQRELTLRAPADVGPEKKSPEEKRPEAAQPSQCPLERAVEQAARQYLYCANPNLSRYAEAAVKLSKAPAARASSSVPRLTLPAVTEPEINPVYALLDEVRDGSGLLSDAASKVLLGRLASAGVPATQILELPSGILTDMFARVGDREVVWQWSRKFADVDAGTFIDLWNKTRIGAFLGFVLVKNLAAAEGEGIKIFADKGVTPEATVAILRSMRGYQGGGRSIGRIIARGFGDTEPMRQFIAETFSKEPQFLFDAILASVDIPDAHMVDYIRSCYEPWAEYRRIPEREAAAIYQALRLTWMQRLKVIFGRPRDTGRGGAGTSEP